MLIGFELLTFLMGITMFMPSAALICILSHTLKEGNLFALDNVCGTVLEMLLHPLKETGI